MTKVRHFLLHAGSIFLLLPFVVIPGIGLPSGAASVSASTYATTTPITHVFLILMENHSYSQVWNTASAPYTTALGKAYATASNYHAITHPSLPNYLDIFAGSNFSITDDCSPSSTCHLNVWNLADRLQAKGLTWKFYQESMPAPCYVTGSGNYAPKHNPAVYFDNIRTNLWRCKSNDITYTSLLNNLNYLSTTPNSAFITPNLCNDMHNCSVSTGDSWLKNHVPAILKSPACTYAKCLVVITWDEDDSSSGNHVLTIFAGSGAKTSGYVSSIAYNHYSLLRTVEYIFGLPTLTTHDYWASPMTDMLR